MRCVKDSRLEASKRYSSRICSLDRVFNQVLLMPVTKSVKLAICATFK